MAQPTSITGNGTTITGAGLNTWAGRVVAVGEFRESVDSIENNDLATTGYDQFIASSLSHHTTIPVTIAFDTTTIIAIGSTVGTISINFSNGGTVSGTGFIKERSMSGVANNERIEGEFLIQFDGDTGPAWTGD